MLGLRGVPLQYREHIQLSEAGGFDQVEREGFLCVQHPGMMSIIIVIIIVQ